MKVGIIGLGVVGKAVKYGMEKLGHTVSYYDPVFSSRWEDILDTEINFICVPTLAKEDGSCDVSIVEQTVDRLFHSSYQGVVVIKSTVTPGTTQRLIDTYMGRRDKKSEIYGLCFVPEFLRERCAEIDFVENHDVCIIGTENLEHFELIKRAHGRYPREFIQLTPSEAEFCKYFNNVYNATLVTLANSMYEVCKSCGVDYSNVKNAIVHRDHITDIYLDCNDSFRGFSGPCLVKDTKAIAYLVRQKGLDINFFSMLLEENSKYPATVWKGMRL